MKLGLYMVFMNLGASHQNRPEQVQMNNCVCIPAGRVLRLQT